MKILSYCNCYKYIKDKNNEILKLKEKIEELKKNIKNLEYELSLKNTNIKNINYENYTINNEFYRTSEDIEKGYTVFD